MIFRSSSCGILVTKRVMTRVSIYEILRLNLMDWKLRKGVKYEKNLKKGFSSSRKSYRREREQGKTISIYLNAESLRYLDRLVEMAKLAGRKSDRSKMVQQLIIQCKNASLAFISMLPDNDKSVIAEIIRKMAGVKKWSTSQILTIVGLVLEFVVLGWTMKQAFYPWEKWYDKSLDTRTSKQSGR